MAELISALRVTFTDNSHMHSDVFCFVWCLVFLTQSPGHLFLAHRKYNVKSQDIRSGCISPLILYMTAASHQSIHFRLERKHVLLAIMITD